MHYTVIVIIEFVACVAFLSHRGSSLDWFVKALWYYIEGGLPGLDEALRMGVPRAGRCLDKAPERRPAL